MIFKVKALAILMNYLVFLGLQQRMRAAERSYPMSKVRGSGREELPHVKGKRSPSKMVGTERGHQRADRNHSHRKLTNLITWTTALSNSMKL